MKSEEELHDIIVSMLDGTSIDGGIDDTYDAMLLCALNLGLYEIVIYACNKFKPIIESSLQRLGYEHRGHGWQYDRRVSKLNSGMKRKFRYILNKIKNVDIHCGVSFNRMTLYIYDFSVHEETK